MGLRALWLALLLAALLAGQELPPGVYRVGSGVSAPLLTSRVEPEYTETARRIGLGGTAKLYGIVGPDGQISDVHLLRSPGLGLGQKAAEAVSQWRFKPGQKGGQPVSVFAQIEVTFRLLGSPDRKKLEEEAEQGDLQSQLRLGVATGSMRWLREAAERGSGEAQALLGLSYDNGLGGNTRDLVQAYLWLALAAQSGTEGAAQDLDLMAKDLSPE